MHYVYILRCADDGFYVGETHDLAHRLAQHQEGAASRYTAQRRPVELAYSEAHPDRQSALARERQIKRWTRAKKKALIVGDLQTLKES